MEGYAGAGRLSEMPEVIGLGQLRSDACTYLGRVAAGETINVVRRGKLVARIASVGDLRVAPIPARSVKEVAADAGETVFALRGGKLVARIVSAARSDARRPA